MECRAEINRFAIFVFCLLVPLGSLAPTETSESKVTAGQREKHFTTEIPTFASVIGKQAHELFEFYHKCVAETFHPEPWNVTSEARAMAARIPRCPAFRANCCALHHIRHTLQSLGSDIKTICHPGPRDVVTANLNQLRTTLSQGTAFFTCTSQEPSQAPPQGQNMSLADRKTYIWWVLKNYKDITQHAEKLYSKAAV